MQSKIRIVQVIHSLLIGLFMLSGWEQTHAQANRSNKTAETYRNPVIQGDFADPSVIRVGDTFYAAGTSSEWAPHYPVFQSKDLINWEQLGYVFPSTPEWMLSSFWAPELFYHKNTFYVYYTVKRKSDNKSVIGVATSKDIRKGFVDHGVVVAYGTESIDAFVLEDNNQLYMSWKAYGLDKRPIEILASKLSADGLKLEGEPFTLLQENSDEKGIEGQCLFKRNGYYYLLYSAGACCGRECSYNVRIARSKSINGPFERYKKNPILDKNDQWNCPGHGTLVKTANERYFYMYHAYNATDNVYTGRQALIDELLWDEKTGWPYFKQGPSPTVQTKIPVSGVKQVVSNNLSDHFDAASLGQFWQWDFRSAQPSIQLENGNLYLSGTTKGNNQTGTALTIRPVSGNYAISTEVVNSNQASKGLVLYGDASQAVGISTKANRIEIWEVKDNKKTILADKLLQKASPLQLKMSVENGYLCQFYYRTDHLSWKEIKPEESGKTPYNGSYLPPWDRSARAGLVHSGEANNPAAFSFFNITYK